MSRTVLYHSLNIPGGVARGTAFDVRGYSGGWVQMTAIGAGNTFSIDSSCDGGTTWGEDFAALVLGDRYEIQGGVTHVALRKTAHAATASSGVFSGRGVH